MSPTTVRHSLVTAAIFGGLTGAVALIQTWRDGAAPWDVWQPLVFFILLMATVGGLVGPLLGGLIRRGGSSGTENLSDSDPAHRDATSDPGAAPVPPAGREPR